MNKTIQFHKTVFSDPEKFEDSVAPITEHIKFRPIHGSKLAGTVNLARMTKVGLLYIDSEPMTACLEPEYGFYGLTLSLSSPFEVLDKPIKRTFNRESAHVMMPDRAFKFRNRNLNRILGVSFNVDNFHDYARHLTGNVDSFQPAKNPQISLTTPAGSGLIRYLSFIMREIKQGGGILNSDLVAKEIEDGLLQKT